ncbi:hypothetical protein [Dulcicalothrix desertica]|uniref:hypothetical protein n=1 Tax=Dulcicalothrix desertica TaxID=32056 RepID=UPI0016470AB1|nr:hypothetical protein [Dulcicalothrix desertica]
MIFNLHANILVCYSLMQVVVFNSSFCGLVMKQFVMPETGFLLLDVDDCDV